MPQDQILSVHIPTRIDQAIARENSRYAINGVNVRFRPDDCPIVEATDGHMLAALECKGDAGDVTTIVPGTLLERRKNGTRLKVNGTISNDKGIIAEPVAGNFPPCHDVMPRTMPDADNLTIVTLNAAYLAKLAKALGDNDAVTLIIERAAEGEGTRRPIRVMPCEPTDRASIGLLMPCTTDKGAADRWTGSLDSIYPRKK